MSLSPFVSMCMIVKNEEKNLRACLEPVRHLVSEIIVMDTGSSDATPRIAAELGAKVIPFAWRDDFSAARNASLKHATGDWIFWLDADDRLGAADCVKLQSLIADLPDARTTYVLPCVSRSTDPFEPDHRIAHHRLFRNHPELRWRGRVHEQIGSCLEALGYQTLAADIEIEHLGYQDPGLLQRKRNRNLRLLRLDYLTNPDDAAVLMHLAMELSNVGNLQAALVYLLRLAKAHDRPCAGGREMFRLLAGNYRGLNRFAEAYGAVLQGLRFYPDDLVLLYEQALLLLFEERYAVAALCLTRLLQTPALPEVAIGMDVVFLKCEAQRLLAIALQNSSQELRAEALLRELTVRFPRLLQPWISLAQIYLVTGRLPEMEQMAVDLARLPLGEAVGAVIHAQVHMARQEWWEARLLLDWATAKAPQLLWTRVVLADWHRFSKQPLDKTIDAYRAVLQCSPGNAYAIQQIAALKARKAPPRIAESSFSVQTAPCEC